MNQRHEHSFILGMIALALVIVVFILVTRNMDVGHSQSWTSAGGVATGFPASVSVTGTVKAALGTGTTPAVIATFGTCDAGHEGLRATQTDSTGACSAGATATNAGTTHCDVYCNASNWVQTGL